MIRTGRFRGTRGLNTFYPCGGWGVNYNGHPHWVTTKAAQRDFATRMQQFFDP